MACHFQDVEGPVYYFVSDFRALMVVNLKEKCIDADVLEALTGRYKNIGSRIHNHGQMNFKSRQTDRHTMGAAR